MCDRRGTTSMFRRRFETPLERAAYGLGDFELELTRARRAPRMKRFTVLLALMATVCGGAAALASGAGNEPVLIDDTTTVSTDAAPPAEPAADPAATTTADPAPAPAPADPPPAEP